MPPNGSSITKRQAPSNRFLTTSEVFVNNRTWFPLFGSRKTETHFIHVVAKQPSPQIIILISSIVVFQKLVTERHKPMELRPRSDGELAEKEPDYLRVLENLVGRSLKRLLALDEYDSAVCKS